MNALKKIFQFIWTYFALLVVAGVFVWSAVVIATFRAEQTPPGTIVLRIGHWQLEGGVRTGLDAMAERYAKIFEEKHPGQKLKIIQDAIPESTYGQWVSTQLMGGTAPDILQVGGQLPGNIWLSYYNRYFLPLSAYVSQANPYNEGTELEGIPLRQTYKDGMKTAYVAEMQEYMSIPLTLFGTRIFYNKTLLRNLLTKPGEPLLGEDEFEAICDKLTDYREFLKVCAQIKARKDKQGRDYIAIAGSNYHFGQWDPMMFSPVTYGCLRKADFNRDGFVGNDEMFIAFKTGLLDFSYPSLDAWLDMIREVTDYFQSGYTGLGRDEAVFLFAQQRAVFMTTGTWDAGSLVQQADLTTECLDCGKKDLRADLLCMQQGKKLVNKLADGVSELELPEGVVCPECGSANLAPLLPTAFEIGIMDFPLPADDDPVYGGVVEGRIYESPGVGFQFGITRSSQNPDVARDFLLFLASQKGNEVLNAEIGWIPSIKGAHVTEFLQAFEPHLEGVYGNINFALGGNTSITWGQQFDLYKVNLATKKEFSEKFVKYYLENGLKDFLEQQRDWRRGIQRNEQYLAGIRGRAILADQRAAAATDPAEKAEAELEAESAWVRYRAITASRQIWGELNHARNLRLINQDSLPEGFVGPYEYSEKVLDAVRARLAEEQAEAAP